MRGQKFEFTLEQEKYIVDNWGKVSAHSMKNMFGCSWEAVVNVAKKYNLDPPKSNKWTEEENELLKKLAPSTHYEDIATIMQKSPTAIYLRAKRLGITLIQDRRTWTSEEEEYLIENWGTDPIEKIAKKMQRSVYSIRVKATRLGLGHMCKANTEQLTVADISYYLGVSHERITETWKNYGLKLKKKKVTKKYSYYCISIEDLMEFLKTHQDLWNANYLDLNIFGIEPDWLTEKRRKDSLNPPIEYHTWTSDEIKLATDLLKIGYDYELIAERLHRTPVAVAYKLRSLGYSYRLSKYWKGKEIKYLKEHYDDMTNEEIGEYLKRTPKAVGAKAEELGVSKLTRKKKGKS